MKELINNLKKLDRKQYIAMTVTGLLLFFGIAILFKGYSVYNTIHTESENWSTSPIPKEQKVFNILLMGYGGPGHDGAYLTDTIMLARIDTENKKVLLISIPRDIWVEIPTEPDEDFYSKINSVYQTGLFSKNYPALLSILWRSWWRNNVKGNYS